MLIFVIFIIVTYYVHTLNLLANELSIFTSRWPSSKILKPFDRKKKTENYQDLHTLNLLLKMQFYTRLATGNWTSPTTPMKEAFIIPSWVVQSTIKLTQDEQEFDFSFVNFLVSLSVNIVCILFWFGLISNYTKT